MKCQYCYAENESGAQFCTNCGAALAQETPVEEVVAAVEETPVEEVIAPVEGVVETPAKDPGKTLGLVSLILGIAALVLGSVCSCAFACLGGSFAFALSAAAVVTGILGMNKSKAAGFKNTLALIGMILGIAALLVNVICTIIGMVGGAAMAESGYYY